MSFSFNKKDILAGAIIFLILIWGIFHFFFSHHQASEKSVYVIARDSTWYPLDLMGREKSMLAFSNDLLLAIAKEEHLIIELVPTSSRDLFQELDDGTYDAILSSLTPSPLNREKYDFSDPFYRLGLVLVAPKSSSIHSLKDMQNRILGIVGSFPQAYDVIPYPNITLKTYDNINSAFENLQRNQIDGVVLFALPAFLTIRAFYPELQVVTEPLTPLGLRLVARHTPLSGTLIEKFNEGLKTLKADGTYPSLLNKWGIIDTEEASHPPSSNPS